MYEGTLTEDIVFLEYFRKEYRPSFQMKANYTGKEKPLVLNEIYVLMF